jgi:Ca-activated chloride channel family protein
MNFDAPARLLLVIAPLALLVAYLLAQRSRRKHALRFTSVDLLASVAPRRAGWQRHIGALLLLLAVVFLVVGFAEPTRTIKVPKEHGVIMMAIDSSGSMAATDVAPTRLAAAIDAGKRFVDALPPGLQVGLIEYDDDATVRAIPTSERESVKAALDALASDGGTGTGIAMRAALDSIAALPVDANGDRPAAAIVLMSDGSPTIGAGGETPEQSVAAASEAAKEAGVPVDTIAFGTESGTIERQGQIIPVPADPEAMEQIADATDGESFTASTADQLDKVYEQIRKTVGYDSEERQITAWFTGIGLAIAVLAACAALLWVQRMP